MSGPRRRIDRPPAPAAPCCSYFIRRLLGLIPTLVLVGILVFLFVHLLPGDPARLAAGPDATPETVALVRQDLGLDRPLAEQFVRFSGGVLRGDFGRSLRTKRPVSTEIAERFWPTFWLTVTSMAWSVVIGMAIGIASAVWRNRWPDRVGMTLAVSGISFPAFALGMLLMQIFAVQLNWLPTVGADTWRHYLLPSLTLGAAVAAIMARFTRSSFVDILQEDYVRTARAKGLAGERGGRQARPAQRAHTGGHHDGAAVRLSARRARSSSKWCSTGPAWAACSSTRSTCATIRSSRGWCCCSRSNSCSST